MKSDCGVDQFAANLCVGGEAQAVEALSPGALHAADRNTDASAVFCLTTGGVR